MWAYTDEEIDYLSTRRGTEASAATEGADNENVLGPLTLDILRRLRAWLDRQAVRAELEKLDGRTLADLGINRGDFPAILAGAYTRASSSNMNSTSPKQSAAAEPRGGLASRTLAMPADANPSGSMFGGWIMALMDAAAAMTATRHAAGRVVTVAVSNIAFLEPVHVGDTVCCYTDVTRTGTTSITLHVEVWVLRQGKGDRVRVTDAEFTFVAVNDNGKPQTLRRVPAAETHPTPW